MAARLLVFRDAYGLRILTWCDRYGTSPSLLLLLLLSPRKAGSPPCLPSVLGATSAAVESIATKAANFILRSSGLTNTAATPLDPPLAPPWAPLSTLVSQGAAVASLQARRLSSSSSWLVFSKWARSTTQSPRPSGVKSTVTSSSGLLPARDARLSQERDALQPEMPPEMITGVLVAT